MASRSHVLRRAERATRDFPERPTLPPDVEANGLAVILRPCAEIPDLQSLRNVIVGLWRGPLSAQNDAPDILVVVFDGPNRVDRVLPGTALPLKFAQIGALASFSQTAETPLGDTLAQDPATLRKVEIWWAGRRHDISLGALTPVALGNLWALPQISIHRPSPKLVSSSEQNLTASSKLSSVSHAKIPITKDGKDLMGEVAAGVRDLEARTQLSAIFKQMFSPGSTKKEGSREPGVLENLAGWLRWHTPLGNPLRRGLADRERLVEKLIASGDIDSALKLALALGAGGAMEAARKLFPLGLPGMRGSLDFRIEARRVSIPLLSSSLFQSMHRRYAELAKRLEQQGDFRRAAYVHSQLLGDHKRAVRTLEAGELFREAAKLAIDSRLEPALAICMLFKAGELDAALALAKRTACFDQLAEDSRGKDGRYHAFVIKAWTDMLVATGQPLRALQVTDGLTEGADPPTPLVAARLRWLALGLGQEGSDGPRAELAARALLMASWTAEDISPDVLDDFPYSRAPAGGGSFHSAIVWVQRVIRGETDDAQTCLIELLGSLTRFANPDRADQTGFWSGPSQPVLEAFARALLEIASNRLGKAELGAIEVLLKKAALPVLAYDLGKLTKPHATEPEARRTWRVPLVTSMRPAVRRGCLLANGSMLVWRESRLLQLLDRYGALLWQGNVSDVVALVAVGGSPHVIVVQAQVDGTHLLTRFATHDRAFHPIGRVKLTAHHDVTSEGQWLVQIGGEIGALDLAKLCAPSPRIEFLWSCALTERLRTIAFAHHAHAASWMTRDISPSREGILEIWSLRQSGELTTSLVMPGASPDEPADWFWEPYATGGRIGMTTAPKTSRVIVPWSDEQERQAMRSAAGSAGDAQQERFQPCDFGRAFVRRTAEAALPDGTQRLATAIIELGANAPSFVFEHDVGTKLTCLARGVFGEPGGDRKGWAPKLSLWADDNGRLFVLDVATLNLTTV